MTTEGDVFLFLDIDGVLHRSDAGDDELLTQMPLLERWLRARPSVRVIVSSSWRHSRTLDELRALFALDLHARIVGVTDVHWKWVYEETGEVPLTTPHERDREVMRWLEANPLSPTGCLAGLKPAREHEETLVKFGPRTPSLKRMLAARTSAARFVRHNLGIKAPQGWGWLTSPKRAAYNRMYSRTSFSGFGLLGSILKALFGTRRR